MEFTTIRCKPWARKEPPKKLLAIRYQAHGDLVITLPYLQSLKDEFSQLQIDLLTRTEVCEIPENLALFDRVISIGGGRNAKVQFILTLLRLPFLWWQRYDVVADLQNHRISRIVRWLLHAKAWTEFDRSSRNFAGERTRVTLDALNLARTALSTHVRIKGNVRAIEKLKENGWDGTRSLVILNPAGAFQSRQWPTPNYSRFATLWLTQNPSTQFLILGLGGMKAKAVELKKGMGGDLIDLTGMTSPTEAFVIIKQATLMVSEDSGLMHMAWVQGVTTLALLGSSPSYWASPLGEWSRCLNSSDLPCGNCFSEMCRFGDVHCLTRYSPQRVMDEAMALVECRRQLKKGGA
jgi:ADP-heptose:LPS heptosyltransferase